MIQKTGQMLQPSVEINGHILADVNDDEVEAWMLANNVVEPTNAEADAPTDQPCPDEMPEEQPIQFKNWAAKEFESKLIVRLKFRVIQVLRSQRTYEPGLIFAR